MISVVVICHNYGNYLKQCVLSIIKNNNKYLKELIIINDSSTDNSHFIARQLQNKYKKIKYFEKNFKRLSKSTNFAISKASGEWIVKVDADDYVSENFIKNFVKNLRNNNKINYVCFDIVMFNEHNLKKKIKQNFVTKNFLFKYPLGSGVFFKKKLWKSINGFNENIFYQDDYDFWLRVRKKANLLYVNKANYFYRKHKKNMSKNIFLKNFTKLYLIIKNIL